MASMNKVFLIGNLTKDPELRRTPAGVAVVDLRMAVNRKFKSADGESRDETCFVNVTAWSRQAETCAQYLAKGSSILVDGRLKFDEWEKEGQKQTRLSVVAERVQFLGSPKQRAESDGQSGSQGSIGSAGNEEQADSGAAADDDDLPF